MRLPGFANAHSHAFQRGLRGGVQARDPSRADTFWTWREQMYAVADSLDLGSLEATTRACYAECLEAGYTAVGEFHYVHHDQGGRRWPDPQAASRAVLAAARQTGIRVTLLWTVYARGGFGAPLSDRQLRFGVSDLDEVRRALDGLAPGFDGQRARCGLAIHSVRAVPPEWLGPLAELARERSLPLHAHVSEQPAEVSACRDATGLSPIGLLAREGVLGPATTLVHATWLDDPDVMAIADSGSTVCVCPTTEGDLGDGVPRTADLDAAGVPLCVGSDSHAVIDPFAEVRSLEYQARAATGRRCVLTDDAGRVAPALARIGHEVGYRALALPAGEDHIWLDPDARALAGCSDLPGAAFTAGHPGLVQRVEVAGDVLVEGGRHVSV